MEYARISASGMDGLWELHRAYKREIGEDAPTEEDRAKLLRAIERGEILFYGAYDGGEPVGCCSVTVGFSTFNYEKSGVFEDFYIRPDRRHRGIARGMVRFAYADSGVASLTVGCADCDTALYSALGFTLKLGNLLAFE